MSSSQQKFLIVIQARMGSTRYPGKVLAPFLGTTLLEFQIALLRQHFSHLPICVASSTNAENLKIQETCKRIGIDFYAGDEANVFSRYLALSERADHLVRLTADNPITCPQILSACLSTHLEQGHDLTSTREIDASNRVIRYVPKGLSVDVIASQALRRVSREALTDFELEHVIPVFYRKGTHGADHRGDYRVGIVKKFHGQIEGEFSVDTELDKKRIEEIFRHTSVVAFFKAKGL
jgi:spore coat polysaccharide biosynthesis protein SpsF